MIKPIKLILADDQALFRKSLMLLLKEKRIFEVIGEAGNGRDLLELLKAKKPDVVLLDIAMPVMDGRAALEIMRNRFPEVKVIVLSYHHDPAYLSEFMAMGANAFLSKGCEVDTLVNSIKKVHQDGYYYDDTTSNAILLALKSGNPHSKTDEHLNDKEKTIVRLICNGKTNKQIATDLYLSPSTIDFHRTKIYTKTKCSNVAQLFHYAIKKNLIAPVN